MDVISELHEVVGLGLEHFKAYIKKKIKEDGNFLQHMFCVHPEGLQQTVLNFLINEHQEQDAEHHNTSKDFITFIDYVIGLSLDKNAGEPLHQAIAQGKLELATHLLGGITPMPLNSHNSKVKVTQQLSSLLEKRKHSVRNGEFDPDRRDKKGRTLLSLAVGSKDTNLLIEVLGLSPNINAVTSMTKAQIDFQPLHQAVSLDEPDAVRLLAHQGAQLANPVGTKGDTPLLLAARFGKLKAMEALLEQPVKQLMLEATNLHFDEQGHGYTAIEELCLRFANNQTPEGALRQIAMLLSCGAEPPRHEDMCHLLSKNRIALLQAIDKYMEDKPDLVTPFVTRCHLAGTPLHNIVYAKHSWESSIRHLFGIPSKAALIVEGLVTRKWSIATHSNRVTTSVAANFAHIKDPMILYAEFVRRYTNAYENQLWPNRWSSMRWLIAAGEANWDKVLDSVKTQPYSRSNIIFKEMFQPVRPVQEVISATHENSTGISPR